MQQKHISGKSTFILSIILLSLVISISLKMVSATGNEDGYEENDTFNTAILMTPSLYNSLYQQDDDWFRVSVPAGWSLKSLIEFNHASNDMKLSLYNDGGNLLLMSDNAYGNESIFWSSIEAKVYTLRISGNNNSEMYSLDIVVFQNDDTWENNDFHYSPSYITTPIQSIQNLIVQAGDPDFFVVTVPENTYFEVKATYNYNFDYLNLSLVDYMNSPLNTSVFYPERNGNVVSYTTGVGSMSIYMVLNTTTFAHYNLSWWNMSLYNDDLCEENDYFNQAKQLDPTLYPTLRQFDDDYYKLYLVMNEVIELKVEYPSGSISVNVYDSAFSNLFLGSSIYGLWNLTYNATYTGYIFLKVSGDNTGFIYSLNYTKIAEPVQDDGLEENDDSSNAKEIGLSYYSGLIQRDMDWYKYWLNNGEQLWVKLNCVTYAQLNLSYMNAGTFTVNSSDISTNDGYLEIKINASSPDYYYFRVSGSDIGYTYSLDLIEGYCDDDAFEENDQYNSPKPLLLGLYSNLVQRDADYFSFSMNTMDIIEVKVNFTGASGFSLFEVDPSNGNYLQTDYSNTDGLLNLTITTTISRNVVICLNGYNMGYK